MGRVLIGMTGATGQRYGITPLELLRDSPHETHLVISDAASININQESEYTLSTVKDLADVVYDNQDVDAPPANGSFEIEGMLVAPCSMKSLAMIANGSWGNLLSRSADTQLKERRPLVLMPREKPLNRLHIGNMLAVTDAGGVIVPPVADLENREGGLDGIVRTTALEALEFVVDTESLRA